MQWSPHINNIATRLLKYWILSGVIWVIVQPQQRPVLSYLSLVRPTMEYASCVWDPQEAVHIQILEKVQQQAARWVLSDYGRPSSVTTMLTQLGWPTLQHRRFISRLIFFTRSFMKLSPWPSQSIFYLPNIQPDNITVITSLSLVIRPQHIRRVFTT